jgi:hypothetical protein
MTKKSKSIMVINDGTPVHLDFFNPDKYHGSNAIDFVCSCCKINSYIRF